MYTQINFKSKKALREAIKNGDEVVVYQPGGMFPGSNSGQVTIEGPHFPQPHSWYARVEIEDRVVTKFIN